MGTMGNFISEMMLTLDTERIRMMRKEFLCRGDEGLSLPQFCHVMKTVLKGKSSSSVHSRIKRLGDEALVAQLTEFFAAVDVDGNGSLEWEEFTSHIVERVMASYDQNPDSIQSYTHAAVKDVCTRRTSRIAEIYHFTANQTIVTVDMESPTLKVYSRSNLELKMALTRPEGFIRCVEYLPKYNQFLVSSTDLMLTMYDELTGVICKSFRTNAVPTSALWIGSYETLYTSESNGTIRAWDVADFSEKFSMVVPAAGSSHQEEQLSEDMSDDLHKQSATTVVAASLFSEFRSVLCMLHLQELEMLATASMNAVIALWDAQTGRRKRILEGHTKGATRLGYSSESRFLMSGGFDFDIIVWNPYVDGYILRLPGHQATICSVVLVPGTPQLVTADVSGVIKIWDVRNFGCVQTLTVNDDEDDGGERDKIARVVVDFQSKKRLLAAGKAIHVYEYSHVENPDLTDDTPVAAVVFNATTMTIMTASSEHVRIWDVKTGALSRICRSLGDDGVELTSICLDTGERKFIIGDNSGKVRSINFMKGEVIQVFSRGEDDDDDEPVPAHTAEISALLYVKEYGLLVTASWDRSLCVFDDVEETEDMLLRVMTGAHRGDITSIAYSKYGGLLASGASDGVVAIWSFEFGYLHGICDQHHGAITAVNFVDPYPSLLAADSNGTFHLWATPPAAKAFECLAAWQAFGPFGGIFDNDDKDDVAIGSGAVLSFLVVPDLMDDDDDDASSMSEESEDGILKITVIAGDDRGNISLWDVAPLMQRLEDQGYLRRLKTPASCEDPRRKAVIDCPAAPRRASVTSSRKASVASTVSSRKSSTVEKKVDFDLSSGTTTTKDENDPVPVQWTVDLAETTFRVAETHVKLQGDGIRHLRTFKAHSDSILSLQYIEEGTAILSSSLDRLVKLWNEDGECLGTLRQRHKANADSVGDEWKFTFCDDRQRRRQVSSCLETMRELHTLQDDERAAAEAAAIAATTSLRGGSDVPVSQLKTFPEDGQAHFVPSADQVSSSDLSTFLEEDDSSSDIIAAVLKRHPRMDIHQYSTMTSSITGKKDERKTDDSDSEDSLDGGATDPQKEEAPRPTPPQRRRRRTCVYPATAGRRVFQFK